MPVCGYVAVPRRGEKARLTGQLAGLAGCEVVPAQNSELLLLVTTTANLEEDLALRSEIEEFSGLDVLLLTFGEIDPETQMADPLSDSA